MFGPAEIIVPPEPLFSLMINEIFNPFYLFQIFSCIFWFYDNSVVLALVAIFYLVCSLFATLWDYHENNQRVRKMARYSCKINLLQRDKTFKEIISDELLPGDIVEVPQGIILPCDLILLTGSAIVNESMLMGESIPVNKTSLHSTSEIYSDKKCTKHTLYGGTRVIQTRNFNEEPIYGLVRNTNFLTAKGSLIREILYPSEFNFKFTHDSEKFILIGFVIALIGICSILPVMITNGFNIKFMIDASLNIIIITVPPALPAALAVGTLFAIIRLKKANIFCI